MWGRRVFDHKTYIDFTKYQLGSTHVWQSTPIIKCPNCGRAGCDFGWGVVHAVNSAMKGIDSCVSDSEPGDAHTIFYDEFGKEVKRWATPLGDG